MGSLVFSQKESEWCLAPFGLPQFLVQVGRAGHAVILRLDASGNQSEMTWTPAAPDKAA